MYLSYCQKAVNSLINTATSHAPSLYAAKVQDAKIYLRFAPDMVLPNHLIIVCGHAIWPGGPKNGWDEAEWLIESYKKGETPTFIEHIQAGVKALAQDDRAVLSFSGYVF